MLNYTLAALAFTLHIAIAVVLIRKYLLTRDVGFIWLGVAVVLWPIMSRLLEAGEHIFVNRIARHELVGWYPFTLVEHGQVTLGQLVGSLALAQQIIGVILLFVAVLYLNNNKSQTVPAV